jgi:tetratricopeptide (TPR) repeat protein
MRFSLTRKMVGLGVLVACMACAAPLFAQTGGLTGTVKGEDGKPLVGYPIIIERQDIKGIYKTKTNKKGEYIYIGLPIGMYKVTLQDPNGRQLFYVQQRVGLGDPTEASMDLQKERARTEQERKSNPEMVKQIEQQEKEQKQYTGLKQVFDQGQALYNEKKYAEAAAMFEQALPLAKDKNVPIVLSRLADSYHKARQLDKAQQYYVKAIEAKPDDASLHNNLGNVYADMGKTTDAVAEFQKAAQIDPPGASRYYFNLGAIMYNQGKMDEAASAFKKATELDPKFADAYFLLGQSLMGKMTMDASGKVITVPGTAEALKEYLTLEPTGKYAAQAQGMLQTIEGKVETEFKAQKKKKS